MFSIAKLRSFSFIFCILVMVNSDVLQDFGNGNRGRGINNQVQGRDNTWNGNRNGINGVMNSVKGSDNRIQGDNNFVQGSGNVVGSMSGPQAVAMQKQMASSIQDRMRNAFRGFRDRQVPGRDVNVPNGATSNVVPQVSVQQNQVQVQNQTSIQREQQQKSSKVQQISQTTRQQTKVIQESIVPVQVQKIVVLQQKKNIQPIIVQERQSQPVRIQQNVQTNRVQPVQIQTATQTAVKVQQNQQKSQNSQKNTKILANFASHKTFTLLFRSYGLLHNKPAISDQFNIRQAIKSTSLLCTRWKICPLKRNMFFSSIYPYPHTDIS